MHHRLGAPVVTIPPVQAPIESSSSRQPSQAPLRPPSPPTGLEDRRGGRNAPPDTYELADYADIQRRARAARRQIKADEKQRWLDERDEMKFSHSIQFNAVPDWSSHYVAYSNLKKLYVAPACPGARPGSNPP